MTTFKIKQNNTSPAIRTTLSNEAGVFNLTGCTVRFVMRLKGAGVAKVAANASLVDATNGVVEYQWVSGDTDTPGTFDAEWKVTLANTRTTTFPSASYDTVEIAEELE